MKLFLIGKNGQLGEEITKFCRENSYKIYSYGKDELDITLHDKVRNEIERVHPDLVINATALHATVENERNAQRVFAVNTFAVKNLTEICKNLKIHFVTYSSDYVFDGLKGKPYIETDTPTPVQMFGLSKYMGELMALNYNSNAIIIRTNGLYGGTHGSRTKGNFVLNFIQDTKGKKAIEVSLEQIVSPTYVEDLVIASFKLIDKNPAGGIYHLANEGFCSWADFSKEIVRAMGLKVKIKPVDRKGLSGGIRRPIFSALKNTSAKKMGISLPSWESGLERYVSFLLK